MPHSRFTYQLAPLFYFRCLFARIIGGAAFIALLFSVSSCGENANEKNTTLPVAAPEVPATEKEFVSRYLASAEIMMDIPSDAVESKHPGGWKATSARRKSEYLCVWEKNLTHEMMQAAFAAGLDDGNGHMSRSVGSPESINDKAQLLKFATYQIRTSQQVSSGYQIHDWSNPKGVLVISVNGIPENEERMKDEIIKMHQSVKIPGPEEIKALLQQHNKYQSARARTNAEQALYDLIAGHALLDMETYDHKIRNLGIPSNGTITFELCPEGTAMFTSENLKKINSNITEPKVSLRGPWDIVTDADGSLRLTITESELKAGRWKIASTVDRRFLIDGIEFISIPRGEEFGPTIECD